MKKLALIALVIVLATCKNYDDRFDALNEQITALEPLADISQYVSKSTGGAGASSYEKKEENYTEGWNYTEGFYRNRHRIPFRTTDLKTFSYRYLKGWEFEHSKFHESYPKIPIPSFSDVNDWSDEDFEKEFKELFSWNTWDSLDSFELEEKYAFLLSEHLSLPQTFNLEVHHGRFLYDSKSDNFDPTNYYNKKYLKNPIPSIRFKKLVTYKGYVEYAVRTLAESEECETLRAKENRETSYGGCNLPDIWVSTNDKQQNKFHKNLPEDVIILPYHHGIYISETYGEKITCQLSGIVEELKKVKNYTQWENLLASSKLKQTIYKDKDESVFDSSFSFEPQVIVEDDFYYNLKVIVSLFAPGMNYFVFAWVGDKDTGGVYFDTTYGVDLSISEVRRFRTWRHKRTSEDKLDDSRKITEVTNSISVGSKTYDVGDCRVGTFKN